MRLALPDSLAVLRRRDFRLLIGAQATSLLGDGVATVALAFAVLGLDGSASDLGIVLAAQTIPLLVFVLVGGVAADRWSRRTVVVIADLVRAAAVGTIAALVIADAATVPLLAGLAAVTGIANAFFQPALTGLLPEAAGRSDLQQANALRGTAVSGSEIAGPALAGVLVVSVGAGWALAVNAASFAISGLLLALMATKDSDERPEPFVRELREGWTEFSSRTWLWATILAASIGNFLFCAYLVLGPTVASESLGGASAWAAISAAFGVGAVIGGLIALRIRPAHPMRTAAIAISIFALPLGLLASSVTVILIAAGAALAGAGMMLANALLQTSMQAHVPEDALSRVSSYDWLGSLALQPVGLLVWGPIAAAVGLGYALWAAFFLQAITAFALLAVPDVRRLTAAPAQFPARLLRTRAGTSSVETAS